ncbi:DUF5615 family PIN-like protein [Flammeovirgaceae bacterium SG7u.111]|nr:DUF5615 family PIN-like protein [Flammeovirgaceae bacterium SG7u.132]WPO33822.1 DUF5615 family PIN-like protein [Flammeovirgaceae bacterium SG7u.111]
MKLLFDQNISYRITKKLAIHFEGCKHVSDCGLSDTEDTEIWKYAKSNDYTIVTFDADFFDISMVNGHPPKIIWVRTGNLTTPQLASLMLEKKTTIIAFLENAEFKNTSCLEIE